MARIKNKSSVLFLLILSTILVVIFFSLFKIVKYRTIEETNLYSFVPLDAVSLFDIHSWKEIEESAFIEYAVADTSLFEKSLLSPIYKLVKLGSDQEPTPNHFLVSQHLPLCGENQLFLFELSKDNLLFVDRLLEELAVESFPSKQYLYRNREIKIYPLADGRFVSVYQSKQLIALSLQARLLEAMIDAELPQNQLLHNSFFRAAYEVGQKENWKITGYLKSSKTLMTEHLPVPSGWIVGEVVLADSCLKLEGKVYAPETLLEEGTVKTPLHLENVLFCASWNKKRAGKLALLPIDDVVFQEYGDYLSDNVLRVRLLTEDSIERSFLRFEVIDEVGFRDKMLQMKSDSDSLPRYHQWVLNRLQMDQKMVYLAAEELAISDIEKSIVFASAADSVITHFIEVPIFYSFLKENKIKREFVLTKRDREIWGMYSVSFLE